MRPQQLDEHRLNLFNIEKIIAGHHVALTSNEKKYPETIMIIFIVAV